MNLFLFGKFIFMGFMGAKFEAKFCYDIAQLVNIISI